MRSSRWISLAVHAALAGVVLAIPAGPRQAHAGETFYAGTLQFATGDYIFTDRTNSLYLFNGVSYATGPAAVSASIPLIYQNTSLISNTGPGMLPGGGGMMDGGGGGHDHHGGMMSPSATTSTDSFDEAGVGDPVVRADVDLAGGRAQRYSLAVSASVKVPVADADRGFGTGEWDYAAGMTGRYTAGDYTGAAGLYYWWMGEPDSVTFDNPVAYSVSAFRRLGGSRFSAGVSASGFTRVLDGVDPFRQLGVTVMYVPAASRSLSAGIVFGMSDSAPDIGVTVGWGFVL